MSISPETDTTIAGPSSYPRLRVLIRALAAGAPLHGSAERPAAFVGLAGVAGSALAGDHNGAHAELVQLVLDLCFAVAPVGGDHARPAPGAADDSPDRGGELRCVGGVAAFDGVVEHNTIVVVDDLSLVAELNRLMDETAFCGCRRAEDRSTR
jgi:hypothetical protein